MKVELSKQAQHQIWDIPTDRKRKQSESSDQTLTQFLYYFEFTQELKIWIEIIRNISLCLLFYPG